MSREKGTLKVSNKLGGTIKVGKNKLGIPKEYELAPRERFNNAACEYEMEGGTIVKVFVNGTELPKDTEAAERKAARIKEREVQEEREEEERENEKKFRALNAKFKNDSFDITKAFCPKDTSDLNIQPFQVENFALKLNRFARFVKNERDYSKSNFEFFKSGKKEPEHQIINNYGDTDFKALTERNERNAKILFGGNCKVFTKSTAGRLITGLGGASVYETDITLHHVYGFPYLPASSIKGVVRSWIIQNVFANEENIKEEGDKKSPLINAEFRALTESKAFCEIFGCLSQATKIELDKNGNRIKDERGRVKTKSYDVALRDENKKGQENQGKVQFFDAFPTKAPKVVPDLMNPHYGPYYTGNGKTPPADYHNPIPIFFLTVDKRTEFQFIIGSKHFEWSGWEIGNRNIEQWLKSALENQGIGAKTAVGYGYMQ
jgi:CRISPR-associated protein Cmr6